MLSSNQIALAVTTDPDFLASFAERTPEERLLLAESHEAIARRIRASLELERRSVSGHGSQIVWRFSRRRA
jgi:hypothetical protein